MIKNTMTIQQIIKKACKKEGMPFEQTYVQLSNAIQNGKLRIFRYENTLSTSVIIQPHVSEIHFITADTPQNFNKAVINVIGAMKKAGFVKLITKTVNDGLFPILQRAHINFTPTPIEGGYQVEIEV
jgi:predicted glycosyl hydrolase (DUF1957 family)